MKTVLITGANRGIGLATAKLLKKRKYKVIGIARKKIRNFPGRFFECDLTNQKSIKQLIKQIKNYNIDCLVNNAGTSFGQSIDDLDLDTFDKSINYYSIIHFVEYIILSLIPFVKFVHVAILSVSWEIIELFIEKEWAKESGGNNLFDIIFNFIILIIIECF